MSRIENCGFVVFVALIGTVDPRIITPINISVSIADMSDKGQGRPILGSGASKPSFQFNLDAPEFVPRTFQAPATDQFQPPAYQETNYGINKLWEAIETLMLNPASFDEILGPLTTALNSSINSDAGVMSTVIEDLFNQATNEANFRYTGARMCDFFANNLKVKIERGAFRQLMLERCHIEHKLREVLVQNPATQTRLVGFTLFMGELLLTMRMKDGNHMNHLVRPIEELLSTLLTQPTDSNLKCVAQVLKLTGAILNSTEKSENDGKTPRLDEIFQKLKKLLVDADCERRTKSLLLSVVELRATDWGGKVAQVPAAQTFPQAAPVQYQHYGEEPVFYDEDGQPIPYEESVYMPDFYDYPNDGGGDWSNAPGMYDHMYNGEEYGVMPDSAEGSMDDEIAADFEKFILDNETAATQNNHSRPY